MGTSSTEGAGADFANANRGFIAALKPGTITNSEGTVIWNADAFNFLQGDCPDTVNPSLWRQSQLCAKQGLYEVTKGIYQVRGLDISNMTLVEGETGVIVIDPLISVECATAALDLYRAHRGNRPVVAVIYTHSHGDHFGGVKGVTNGEIPILAPIGFMEHAVSENIYAGTAMGRRGSYMYGTTLATSPTGNVGVGLGMGTSTGEFSLLPPTVDITHTGQEETIDGIRILFQLTPGTEAPSEMNFYFPDFKALCMAENATHNMHNILTLRGAQVRDSRQWSRYLAEALNMFGADSEVLFASHHWPTWGTNEIRQFISEQRDLYAYLHDQTLRLMNQGHTGIEIAEMIQLPPSLATAWHARGYYGSVSHNVKAIYQRYMGWFDGNPAHLAEHPPTAAAKRYVECMGGLAAVIEHARRYRTNGDLRFAAQLLNHAVYAHPDQEAPKHELAGIYEELAAATENATWRNFYLTGAKELRGGVETSVVDLGGGMATALSIEQIFDTMAIRVAPPMSWEQSFSINWHFTEPAEQHRMELSNGTLAHWSTTHDKPADVTVRATKSQLLGLLAGADPNELEVSGDLSVLSTLTAVLDDNKPDFPIVTPRESNKGEHDLAAGPS
ncbi:MAG: MBL fold metallo-hydrolase [Corynebacteriales bacterium]|nr:MBL fold metallo-hydrolase [Mycobacteriales bacterium]